VGVVMGVSGRVAMASTICRLSLTLWIVTLLVVTLLEVMLLVVVLMMVTLLMITLLVVTLVEVTLLMLPLLVVAILVITLLVVTMLVVFPLMMITLLVVIRCTSLIMRWSLSLISHVIIPMRWLLLHRIIMPIITWMTLATATSAAIILMMLL
jgi:hypothetical protein